MKRLTIITICGVLLFCGVNSVSAGSYIQKVQATQAANLAGYWPLNETTGYFADDLSGNNNDATYGGAALGQYQTLDNGVAAFVDGQYAYISVFDTPALSPSTAITLALWWSPVSPWLYNNAFLVQKSSGLWTDGGYGLFWADASLLRVGAWVDDYQSNLILYDLQPSVAHPGWFHLVLVYDSEYVRFYQDGVEVQNIYRPGLNIRAVAEHLYITSGGAFAHLAIWNIALTADQIAELADPIGLPDATATPALPVFSEAIELSSGRTAGLFYSLTAGDVLIALFLFMILGVSTLAIIQRRQ